MGFRPRHADARRDARGRDGWSLAVLCLARPRAGLARGLGAYPAAVLGNCADPSGHGWVQGEFVRFPGVGAALRRPDAAEGARPSGRSARRFLPAGGPWSRRAWGRALATGRAYVTELRATEGRSNIAPARWRSHCGRRDTVLGEILAAHMAPCPDLLERLVAEVAVAVSARGAGAFPDDRQGRGLVRSRRATCLDAARRAPQAHGQFALTAVDARILASTAERREPHGGADARLNIGMRSGVGT